MRPQDATTSTVNRRNLNAVHPAFLAANGDTFTRAECVRRLRGNSFGTGEMSLTRLHEWGGRPRPASFHMRMLIHQAGAADTRVICIKCSKIAYLVIALGRKARCDDQ